MRIATALAALVMGLGCLVTESSAEVDYLAEIYGDGVHAFYSCRQFEARKFFDQAISHGYKDPRCYYYRAILNMQEGREYEAEQDIKTGARYELEGRGTYDIGRALYRFQGYARVKFERMRRDAKTGTRLQPPRAVPTLHGTFPDHHAWHVTNGS